MNLQSRLLSLAVLALASAKATGGEPQLVFIDSNDENKVVRLADVSRVTFGTEGLTVTTDTDRELPYTSLKRMVFDHDGSYNQSSVTVASADLRQGNLIIDNAAQTLAVAGAEEETTSLEIYTTTGRTVLAVKNYHSEAVDISALPSGVYIVRTDLYSAKFIKK
ncbi:MAG: T9SS type A sorting domain-containing protein [Muribaculaceae bacterium]|nr:T9SS type A sorting domain-containing protein [Muribaculaceae bacterium]